MRIWNFLGAFIDLLDDDDFFTGLTTLEDDGNLSRIALSIPDLKRSCRTFPGLYTWSKLSEPVYARKKKDKTHL